MLLFLTFLHMQNYLPGKSNVKSILRKGAGIFFCIRINKELFLPCIMFSPSQAYPITYSHLRLSSFDSSCNALKTASTLQFDKAINRKRSVLALPFMWYQTFAKKHFFQRFNFYHKEDDFLQFLEQS